MHPANVPPPSDASDDASDDSGEGPSQKPSPKETTLPNETDIQDVSEFEAPDEPPMEVGHKRLQPPAATKSLYDSNSATQSFVDDSPDMPPGSPTLVRPLNPTPDILDVHSHTESTEQILVADDPPSNRGETYKVPDSAGPSKKPAAASTSKTSSRTVNTSHQS